MKRFISVVLCFVFLLSACSKKEVDVSQPFREYAYVEIESLPQYDFLNTFLKNNEDPQIAIPDVSGDTFALHVAEGNVVYYKRGKNSVDLKESLGFPFAAISSTIHANPFGSFNTLVANGLVKKDDINTEGAKTDGVEFDFSSCGAPLDIELNSILYSQKDQNYAFTKEGCEEFVKAVITIAKTNTANLNSLRVGEYRYPSVSYSPKDDCYYAFVINYDTNYAYITAIYLRSSDDKIITEVTLQNMYIEYPARDGSAGSSIGILCAEAEARFEVLTLLTAIEQTLVGTCYFAEYTDIPISHDGQKYTIPFEYQLGDYTVKLYREKYSANVDKGYHDSFEQHICILNKKEED